MIGCITQEAIDAGNKTAGPPGVRHVDHQGELSPARLAALRQTGETAAPGSGYHEHAYADAAVHQADFASASGEHNLRQLGERSPSGDPAVIAGQAVHSAPTRAGAQFRVSPPRDMSGLPAAVCLTSAGRRG